MKAIVVVTNFQKQMSKKRRPLGALMELNSSDLLCVFRLEAVNDLDQSNFFVVSDNLRIDDF